MFLWRCPDFLKEHFDQIFRHLQPRNGGDVSLISKDDLMRCSDEAPYSSHNKKWFADVCCSFVIWTFRIHFSKIPSHIIAYVHQASIINRLYYSFTRRMYIYICILFLFHIWLFLESYISYSQILYTHVASHPSSSPPHLGFVMRWPFIRVVSLNPCHLAWKLRDYGSNDHMTMTWHVTVDRKRGVLALSKLLFLMISVGFKGHRIPHVSPLVSQ